MVGAVKRVSERLCVRRNRDAWFVCVSDGVAEEVRRSFPAVAARVRTIHNGVDTAEFAPGAAAAEGRALRAELGLDEGALVAAFIGGDWEHKGLRHLIEALALAPGWQLAVAGRGQPRHYRELAAELGVDERIRWLGVRADVRPVYAMADAFVLPSSYETFSLVAFEAAASGLPVIASDVNGVRELITSGESGYLVEPRAEEIADAAARAGRRPRAARPRRARRRASRRCASAGSRWCASTTSCSSSSRRLRGALRTGRRLAAERVLEHLLERVGGGGHREQPPRGLAALRARAAHAAPGPRAAP